MWEISLTCHMLFHVWSFSYTLHDILWEEFLLHGQCCFMWGVFLTCAMLFYVENFSCMPHVVLYGEFRWCVSCYFLWEVSVTCPMLFRVGWVGGGSSYAPHTILCGFFTYTHPILFYVVSFSYMPHAVLCGAFLTLPKLFYVGSFLHSQCCFMWDVSYIPHAVLCGEFLTLPMLFYVGSFSFLWEVCHQIDKPTQEQGMSGKVCIPCLRWSKCHASMTNLPWFLSDPLHPAGTLASLLAFAMDRHSLSGFASVQMDLTCVSTHQSLNFTSFVLFSFCVSFAFASHGPILITVALIVVLCFHTHLDPVENDNISNNS